MKTNPNSKRILLYGDSLVYGKKPGVNERWDANERFSGVLQDKLGDDYEVIEEGLRARNLNGENSFFPERNGLEQFGPILGSHLAVDLVVIALGSNDCNSTGVVDEKNLTDALDSYQSKISHWVTFLNTPTPKILIVIPPVISAESFDTAMNTVFGPTAPEKQRKLEATLKSYCERNALLYLLASSVCEPAKNGDGIHLDGPDNQKLGIALHRKVLELLS